MKLTGKKWIITAGIGMLAVGLSASFAYAEEDVSGAYVGTSLGYLKSSNLSGRIDGALATRGLTTTSNSSNASLNPDLKLGYRINANYALETNYTRFGSINVQTTFNSPVSDNTLGTFSSTGYGLHGLVSTTLSEGWTMTGRLGLEQWRTNLNLASSVGGVTSITNNSKHFSSVYGLGLSYALSENVDITYDFTHYNNVGDAGTTGQIGINAISAGMRYRFE